MLRHNDTQVTADKTQVSKNEKQFVMITEYIHTLHNNREGNRFILYDPGGSYRFLIAYDNLTEKLAR